MKRINTTSPSLTVLLLLQPALSHSLRYIYNIFTASTQTYPTLSSTSINCWLFYCSQKLTLSSETSYTCYRLQKEKLLWSKIGGLQVAQESIPVIISLIQLIHADSARFSYYLSTITFHRLSYCKNRSI